MWKTGKWAGVCAVLLVVLMTAVSCDFSSDRGEGSSDSSHGSVSSEEGSLPSKNPIPSFVESEIDNIHNLALKAEAFADSVSTDYQNYTADRLNDGDMLSRWESEKAGTEEEPSTFGLVWQEPQVLDVILIFWNANHPAEDGFTLEVEEVFPEGEASLLIPSPVDSGEEEEPLYRVYRRNTDEDDGQMDVVVFSRPVTAKSLTVTCTKPYYSETYHVEKNQPSCYEVEVYYSVDVEGELSAVEEEDLLREVTTQVESEETLGKSKE